MRFGQSRMMGMHKKFCPAKAVSGVIALALALVEKLVAARCRVGDEAR